MNNLVWYACYGSNISYDRFMYYIKGGCYPATRRTYPGCSDTTPPGDSRAVLIPYAMYFANESQSWKQKGVAFLDLNTPSRTPGRAYLITEDQFAEIHCQEGKSAKWYNLIVNLGTIDGHPVKTFTNSKRLCDNPPSEDYLNVIKNGLEELRNFDGPIILGQGNETQNLST